ncbi:hypothetical protein D3C71_1667290 [compost metagenome]
MNLSSGEFLQKLSHYMLDVPLAHRRLVGDENSVRRKLQGCNLLFLLNQMNSIRCNANGSFRLRVTLFTDIDHFITLSNLLRYEHMSLGYVGACGVHGS